MDLTFVPGVEPTDTGAANGRCFAFRGSDLLVLDADLTVGTDATVPTAADLARAGMPIVRRQFLGRLGDESCWSIELAPDAEVSPGARFAGLRALYGLLPEPLFAIAGRAAQIVAWERDHQFCGRCGTPTVSVSGERARRCPACGLVAYPRLSPAVIMLVERDGRILLARGPTLPRGRFAVLAGFVEPGESLEDAVRREVREEVGIELADVFYFGSQPWPFPHTIMIGFTARHASGDLTPDATEIVEAAWFGIDDLPRIPPKLSIARRLIDAWAARQGRELPDEVGW